MELNFIFNLIVSSFPLPNSEVDRKQGWVEELNKPLISHELRITDSHKNNPRRALMALIMTNTNYFEGDIAGGCIVKALFGAILKK